MMVYLQLLWSYIKIGLFGFGGGYAMLSLIENEIVKHGDTPWWGISEVTFTDIVAISQMTPGPIGINSATYIGYVVPTQAEHSSIIFGILGSIVCTFAVVLPPFLLVMYTSHFISRHKDSPAVKGIFAGLRPVVVGLIASAALLLMNGANFGTTTTEIIVSVSLCMASFLTVRYTKIHPIAVIAAAGLAGFIFYYLIRI